MLTQAGRSQAEPKGGQKRGTKPRNGFNTGPQYEFVTSVGPHSNTAKIAAAKQVVRIHAMRSFLRQRDAKVLDGESENGGTTPIRQYQAPIAGKFKLDSWSRKSSKRKGKAQDITEEEVTAQQSNEGLPSIRLDLGPFELLNIPLTPQVRRLLHHCKTTTYRHEQ
jgi:hypothetical protein